MLNIRKAAEKDDPEILALLKDKALDLYYKGLQLKDFWVAEKNNKIVGVVQLEEFDNFVFLGSLGTDPKEQKIGIASSLIAIATKDIKKPIYLFTIIPDFFKRHGFTVTKPIPGLPSKEHYECEACFPDKCVTMVKNAA